MVSWRTPVVLVLVALAAGCGGGGDDAPAPPPADIAASVRGLGGDPALLSEVTPAQVYRTPKGYLFGYCDGIPDPKQVVTANICTSSAPR